MFSNIYLLLRKIAFSCWWRASEEKMNEIANHYNYQLKVMPPSYFSRHPILKGVRLIGGCRYTKRILEVSTAETRVFWHELGHAVATAQPFSRNKIIDWIISEILATVVGYHLNLKWAKREVKVGWN